MLDSTPSLPVSRSTYVPACENVAVRAEGSASPNVTVPGPLNLLHVVVSGPPGGQPVVARRARERRAGREA